MALCLFFLHLFFSFQKLFFPNRQTQKIIHVLGLDGFSLLFPPMWLCLLFRGPFFPTSPFGLFGPLPLAQKPLKKKKKKKKKLSTYFQTHGPYIPVKKSFPPPLYPTHPSNRFRVCTILFFNLSTEAVHLPPFSIFFLLSPPNDSSEKDFSWRSRSPCWHSLTVEVKTFLSMFIFSTFPLSPVGFPRIPPFFYFLPFFSCA